MKNIDEKINEIEDTVRKSSIYLTGVLEGGERGNGAEKIFEKIVVENFP